MQRIEDLKKKIEELSKPYQDDPNKSDMSNDMRAFRQGGKKNKAIKVLYFLEKILPSLERNRFKVEEFAPNSFRITDGIKQIDYFPASRRLFTNDKKWVTIKRGSVEGHILKHLGYKS